MAQKLFSKFRYDQPTPAEREQEQRHKEILETSSRRKRRISQTEDERQDLEFNDDLDIASADLIRRLTLKDAEVDHDRRFAEYYNEHEECLWIVKLYSTLQVQ